jgi:peptidoglycan hydrolase CwlO-like protein
MAQDFQAAFHLGTDDKHIATVDADGVLFASVQALHEELQETKAQLAAKDSRIAALEQKLEQMNTLAVRLAAVEKVFARAQKSSNPGVPSALQGSEGAVP